jgi:hypothetical protein
MHKKPTQRSKTLLKESRLLKRVAEMDKDPIRFAIAGGVILLYAVFYFSQKLFEAYNFNDFGEYYLRAQDWANGVFRNSGGSDILLSVLEYFAILAHPHDFLASYRLTSHILIALTMAASFLFVVRRNEAMPDFWTKLTLIILTLSIPHFIFATVTIDQTLLFAACLLFFLSTYNMRWAGPVALLAFFSRPEAIIILPLYALLFWVDRKRRKDIAINALTFIALLVLAKWLIINSANVKSSVFAAQEYSFLDKLGWDYLRGFLRKLLNIPLVVALYGYETLQSTILWVFFLLGLVLSLRQRSAWVMYGVILCFIIANITLSADSETKSFSYLIDLIKGMQNEEEYFMVKAFQKFDSAIGHGRYRLVLYPAIAYFVVMGFVQTIALLLQRLYKKSFTLRITPVAALFLVMVALYNVAVAYRPIAREYAWDKKLERMHPFWKLGLEIRKSEGAQNVFIDSFCDESDGSFFVVFSTFSGTDMQISRFCKYSVWMEQTDGRRELVNHKDYEASMPANPYLFGKFYRSVTKAEEMYDSTRVYAWEQLARTHNDSILQAEGITHIITGRNSPNPNCVLLDSLKGVYLYRRVWEK